MDPWNIFFGLIAFGIGTFFMIRRRKNMGEEKWKEMERVEGYLGWGIIVFLIVITIAYSF